MEGKHRQKILENAGKQYMNGGKGYCNFMRLFNAALRNLFNRMFIVEQKTYMQQYTELIVLVVIIIDAEADRTDG